MNTSTLLSFTFLPLLHLSFEKNFSVIILSQIYNQRHYRELVVRFWIVERAHRQSKTWKPNDNHGQKWWHIWAKQTLSISVHPSLKKSIFCWESTPPPPNSLPFQCWNRLRGQCHVITTLKSGEGVEMWETYAFNKKGIFSGSVSTNFLSMIGNSLAALFLAPTLNYPETFWVDTLLRVMFDWWLHGVW